MPKFHEIRVKMKNSNQNFAPNSAKTVSYSKFLIEKNAKNTAYFFIFSNNLLKEFQKFCVQHKGVDAHEACVELLLQQIQEGGNQ